jgi:hypothetical protein
MTEGEWLRCADPLRMLQGLRCRVSERKLRLFACACCRRVWHLLEPDYRTAVEAAERFADGRIGWEELAAVAHTLPYPAFESEGAAEDACAAAWAACAERGWDAASVAFEAAGCAVWAEAGAVAAAGDAEFRLHCQFLHDLFGNRFRPTPFIDPAWLAWDGGAVQRLARAIYDNRSFDDMPLLADVLGRAGCTDQDLLAHCRKPAEHVRGCWALDLLLLGARVEERALEEPIPPSRY